MTLEICWHLYSGRLGTGSWVIKAVFMCLHAIDVQAP